MILLSAFISVNGQQSASGNPGDQATPAMEQTDQNVLRPDQPSAAQPLEASSPSGMTEQAIAPPEKAEGPRPDDPSFNTFPGTREEAGNEPDSGLSQETDASGSPGLRPDQDPDGAKPIDK